MRGRSHQATRLGVAIGVALAASAIGLVPALAPVPASAAAPGLTMVGATTYDVLPEEGRVAVTVQLTATNHLKDTVTSRYFFKTGYVTVIPGASNYEITGDSGKAKVSVSSSTPTYTNLKIDFGANLAAGKSTTLRLTFDLRDPGGAPDRALRISHSFVSFEAWAVATPSTPGAVVDLRFPEGYAVTVGPGPLIGPVRDATGHEIWSSGVLQAPLEFVADVAADRPAEYAERSLAIPLSAGLAAVVLRSWPDDTAWRDRVGALVERALPILERLIGVPWPMDGPFVVHEALARTIGGYEGVFDPSARSIEIAYSASDGVVLHELAHAWFNGSLVGDRWAAEGFAAYYAELAAKELAIDSGAPAPPATASDSAIPLNAWGQSGSGDPATETWAYAASLELAREIAEHAGADALQSVWSKAARGIDGYHVDPPAGEPAAVAPDWRGLLDLLETESSADLTDLWRRWVARPDDLVALVDRAAARLDYRHSAQLAGEWQLPTAPRLAMRAWQFDVARDLLLATDAVLAQRDRLEQAAAAAGATLPGTLRRAFEGEGGLAAAAAEAAAEQTVVDAVAAAEAAQPREAGIVDRLVVDIGLLSADPDARLAEALTALAAGDLETAYGAATAAEATWSTAAPVGQARIVSAVLVALVLLLAVALIRRRRRARPPAIA